MKVGSSLLRGGGCEAGNAYVPGESVQDKSKGARQERGLMPRSSATEVPLALAVQGSALGLCASVPLGLLGSWPLGLRPLATCHLPLGTGHRPPQCKHRSEQGRQHQHQHHSSVNQAESNALRLGTGRACCSSFAS